MKLRKQTFAILLVVLIVLIGPIVWFRLEIRHQTLDQALMLALKTGNEKKAFTALAEGANGEARDSGGAPSFGKAWMNLKQHFRRNIVSLSEEEIAAQLPPLLILYHAHYRVNRRKDSGPDQALVKALLEHGARARDPDEYDTSSLWYASCFSNTDDLQLLLASGADVDSSDCKGITALMNAVIDGRVNVARILLEHGANVSLKEMHGQTALDFVREDATNIESPSITAKIAALLRKYGAK